MWVGPNSTVCCEMKILNSAVIKHRHRKQRRYFCYNLGQNKCRQLLIALNVLNVLHNSMNDIWLINVMLDAVYAVINNIHRKKLVGPMHPDPLPNKVDGSGPRKTLTPLRHCHDLSISATRQCSRHFHLPSVLWRCWLGGGRGTRPVKNRVVRCLCGYLSGARCRLAYDPADATATHCPLLQ